MIKTMKEIMQMLGVCVFVKGNFSSNKRKWGEQSIKSKIKNHSLYQINPKGDNLRQTKEKKNIVIKIRKNK